VNSLLATRRPRRAVAASGTDHLRIAFRIRCCRAGARRNLKRVSDDAGGYQDRVRRTKRRCSNRSSRPIDEGDTPTSTKSDGDAVASCACSTYPGCPWVTAYRPSSLLWWRATARSRPRSGRLRRPGGGGLARCRGCRTARMPWPSRIGAMCISSISLPHIDSDTSCRSCRCGLSPPLTALTECARLESRVALPRVDPPLVFPPPPTPSEAATLPPIDEMRDLGLSTSLSFSLIRNRSAAFMIGCHA
jgi:hypothetical protein